ncbi:hypothetical protein Glove_208g199 [Diversispora epigaea]|uniref:Methyltransferase domain-containing protein n=1 Tax=Diversispora epigaea TaxID=1348612 RepID=A0A397ISJ9_9GLOM|nr:hypothetical protein Glove_208g199 [Diversispora epigaea]
MGNIFSTIFERHKRKIPTNRCNNSRLNNSNENVRQIHNNSPYILPNDEKEGDRLIMQHFITRSVFKSNFCAPVNDILQRPGAKVLDVGCGPGTWLHDMASDFPNARFIGVDISPMFPKLIKPRNVEYLQANFLKGLPFCNDTFDFVVIRNMISVLTIEDWKTVLQELTRVCKPMGYVESTEFGIPVLNEGPMSSEICKAWINIMKSKNIDLSFSVQLPKLYSTFLKKVGSISQCVTIGLRGDQVSKDMAEDLLMLAEALQPALHFTDREFEEHIEKLRKELEEYEVFCDIQVVWGLKTYSSTNNSEEPS